MAKRSADNVKAGVFVLLTLAIAVAITITLAGARELLTPAHIYVVRFSLAEGVAGLQPGAKVLVGGWERGTVRQVAYDDPQMPTAIEVRIGIDPKLAVYTDAVAYLDRPLLGSRGTLNFVSLGGAEGATRLNEGDVLEGAIAAPDVLARAGYGPVQARQLQDIMARADDLTQRFDRIVADIEEGVVPGIRQAATDVETLVADARERSGLWFDNIDTVTNNAVTVTEDARAGLDEARDLVAQFQEMVEANREAIDNTIANAEEASETVNDILDRAESETLAMVNGLLEDGRAGVNEARATIEKADTLLIEQTPEIRMALANARLATEQLRLTMGEVRRTPWRLLYRPNKKELEFELLYDATRSYASAVSDLRAASASLEAVVASGRDTTADGQPVDSLVAEVNAAFERYQAAEQKFVELLGANTP
jgi:ABC-type transporter Mla subunit MlaD